MDHCIGYFSDGSCVKWIIFKMLVRRTIQYLGCFSDSFFYPFRFLHYELLVFLHQVGQFFASFREHLGQLFYLLIDVHFRSMHNVIERIHESFSQIYGAFASYAIQVHLR